MQNLSRSGKKTRIETEEDIRRQPIKVRLEAEELMAKLENLYNFDQKLGQEWNDQVKYVFADIDERDEVNDANFHEAMATAQAFGINNTDSFYVTAYIALVYHKFSLYPNDVKLVKEFTIEGKDGNVLVQTLGASTNDWIKTINPFKSLPRSMV